MRKSEIQNSQQYPQISKCFESFQYKAPLNKCREIKNKLEK